MIVQGWLLGLIRVLEFREQLGINQQHCTLHSQHSTRMIPGMKQLPYEERLGQLGLWSLEERRNRADLLQLSLKCSRDSHPYHSVSSSPSAITLLLEVTQQKSINFEVHWTSEDFSFPKESSIDGICYIHCFYYLEFLQELFTAAKKSWDGLHGLACPPGPLASSVPEIRHRSRCGHTWYVTWYITLSHVPDKHNSR